MYFDWWREVVALATKLKDNEDFDSKDLYFDSDLKFKQFIEFWNKYMIPVECYWSSNLNGPAIRWRLPSLSYNQQEWIEAESMLRDLTHSVPLFKLNNEQIQIDTIEQLKLLHAVSVDLQEIYFMVFSII